MELSWSLTKVPSFLLPDGCPLYEGGGENEDLSGGRKHVDGVGDAELPDPDALLHLFTVESSEGEADGSSDSRIAHDHS